MKKLLTIFGLSYLFLASAQQKIEEVFPLKWKQKIGVTTYRTNMVLDQGLLFIGSNGEDRNQELDKLDGIYALDATTGKLKWHFQMEMLGDNDVTGVAVSGDKVFFGTDNYYFFCLNKDTGKQLWKFRTPNDVESMSTLADLNGDSKEDVVFTVENFGVYVLDSEDGRLIWKQDSIGTSGNHVPLCLDLNEDGVKDVIVGGRGTPYTNRTAGFKMEHYGDYLFAFDGKNGKPLWQVPFGSNLHASPVAYKDERIGWVICMVSAYCELKFLNVKGEKLWSYSFGYGCFASPSLSDHNIGIATSWGRNGGFGIYEKSHFVKEDSKYKYADTSDVVSSSSAIADISGDDGMEFIALDEANRMLIIPESKNEDSYHLILPKGGEATPYVLDVDGDGTNEILVASLDGYLYCYSTNKKGKVLWEGFRGGRKNGVY
ncbi:MAG: PQQ-binding-like beta-propeller repeat protein [Crocinitomicaceae bacterium]